VRLTPESARLRRGELALFRAVGSSGEVRAQWESKDAHVLAAVGGGFFQAMKRGNTSACAVVDSSRICAPVEVMP
jgi:hypothetical protein